MLKDLTVPRRELLAESEKAWLKLQLRLRFRMQFEL